MGKLNVPIVKAKAIMEIETDELPVEVYLECLLQGLKVVLNRGTSKITSTAYPKEEELKAAALAKAEEQLALAKEGKIRFSTKAKKVSGAVNTEAMKIARQMVKDAIKAEGGKVSHYAASEITKAAKALIEVDPSIIELAEEEIKRREEKGKAATASPKFDLKALISVDPKKVAAAEEKKAKPKAEGQLSAAKSGQTTQRSKPPGGKGKTAPAAQPSA